jgi:hypothetical protein
MALGDAPPLFVVILLSGASLPMHVFALDFSASTVAFDGATNENSLANGAKLWELRDSLLFRSDNDRRDHQRDYVG